MRRPAVARSGNRIAHTAQSSALMANDRGQLTGNPPMLRRMTSCAVNTSVSPVALRATRATPRTTVDGRCEGVTRPILVAIRVRANAGLHRGPMWQSMQRACSRLRHIRAEFDAVRADFVEPIRRGRPPCGLDPATRTYR